jgi:hypothetical protein
MFTYIGAATTEIAGGAAQLAARRRVWRAGDGAGFKSQGEEAQENG